MIDRLLENLRLAMIYWRRYFRWSQSYMAIQAGISCSFISKFEQRKVKNLELKTFLRICLVLGLSPNELLGWDNTKNVKPERSEKLPYFYFNHEYFELK